jgi:signal peptidase I
MPKVARTIAWIAVVVIVVGVVLRVTALRWQQLPTNDPYLEASVMPTLEGGDWVLLWRLTSPKLGDLAVCAEPNAPPTCTGEGSSQVCTPRYVIGRIHGVGGDRLAVDGTSILYNGEKLKSQQSCPIRTFQSFVPNDASRAPMVQYCDYEESFTRVAPRGNTIAGQPTPKPVPALRVPEGHYYLISDNRQYPYDSRDFGPVPVEDCKERVVLRLVSRRGYFDADRRFTPIP